MLNDKICILPWIHMEARSSGHAAPCCIYTSGIGNFNKNSLEKIWNSDSMNAVRNYFLENNDFPPGCVRCKNVEASGNKSKRLTDNERFSKHMHRIGQPLQDPVYLDLKFGTVCNLKCRSCSSSSSYKWTDDEIKLYGQPLADYKSYWIDDNKPLWDDLEKIIPTIEHFDFTGGEPLLIKRHFDLLRKAVNMGYSKNITLHYNTNGTVEITNDMIDLWKEFKNVDIAFSIDGVTDKFEYMRNPGKWSDLMSNMNFVRSTNFIYTTICHTISSFNIYYLDEFLEWTDSEGFNQHEVYLNLLHRPQYMASNRLPLEAKDMIKQKLKDLDRAKNIVNFMYTEEGTDHDIDEFVSTVKGIDLIRNEQFSLTFPEYYNSVLKKYFES